MNRVVGLACLLAVACGGGRGSIDTLLAQRASTIVNGTRSPQNTHLSNGQVMAIGYLADGYGSPFCTGTLTDESVVVTARHCVEGAYPSQIAFGLGQAPTSPAALLDVADIRQHPSIDFALLLLDRSAVSVVPDLRPIALNRTPLSSAWVGRWVDASGFGETYSNADGRFFASVEIESYDSQTVTVNGHGEQGICFGDSGGPIIWQIDASSAPVIVGTEQWGDPSCVGRDHLTRIDVVASWIDNILGVPDPDCGDIDYLGLCDGNTAVWCDEGTIRQKDCGTPCGWLGPEVGYYCLPSSCGTVDHNGVCDGNTLSWCSAEHGLQSTDCGREGQSCGWVSDAGSYDCVDDCTRCGGICTDIMNSNEHCGACDNPCHPAQANGQCGGGQCQITECLGGYVDADGMANNGCEQPGNGQNPSGYYYRPSSDGIEGGCHALGTPTLLFALAPVLLLARTRRKSRVR
ncbi:trypsin-like serine protease [Myxococcota bacterium]